MKLVGALTLTLLFAAPLAHAETRRLAIVVGNNAGGGDMPPLRYAESDAGKMARVLVELGDVNQDDVLLLQGRRVADVERAITDARERVAMLKATPDVRTALYFYFSGHSDGESIELGPERLAYARLKALLAGTGADVRLVMVDACRSGAGLREKGGKPAPGFTIRLADTLSATGDVFITSSAADESSLESSEVMGSYFTHNFISGLRGAADTSGDKLVTLSEAYKYAYDATVNATAMLSVGAQHPNYDYKLSGQGELVLASLQKPSAVLVLPTADRTLVTDLNRDQVIVETLGGAKEVALAPGNYGVRVFKGGQGYGGRVTLTQGSRAIVDLASLTPIRSSTAIAAKGGPLVTQQLDAPEKKAGVNLGVSVGGTGRILAREGSAVGPKWQLRIDLEPFTSTFVTFGGGRLTGQLHILALGEMSFDAGDEATAANEAGAQARLGYRLALDVWRLTFGLGLEVGGGVLAQRYAPYSAAGVIAIAPRFIFKAHFTQVISLLLSADLTVTYLNYGETVQTATARWIPRPSVSAGLMFAF